MTDATLIGRVFLNLVEGIEEGEWQGLSQ